MVESNDILMDIANYNRNNSIGGMMEYKFVKIFALFCIVVLIMIGLNNIDSVMSSILTKANIDTSTLQAESLFMTGMNIRVTYHFALMLVIGGMLLILMMYLYELLLKKEKQ